MIDNKFITNYTENTFLDSIKTSIERCNSFCFSVSFIKKAGLVLIEKIIEDALERGVNGKIITSTYQNFTDIASLRTFMQWMNTYPNFECHLDYNCFGENGFHSKGYLFEYDNDKEFIVGSTNITRFALLKNIEWNVSLKSNEEFESSEDAQKEFNELWNKTEKLNNDLIKRYQMQLDYAIDKWDMDYYDPISLKIKPNAMQRKALKEVQRYRDMGVNRALVVSATGSGKTYLAAFDARNYAAKRVLFVVHRDKILTDAKETFMKVFGAEKSYGLYVGKHKDIDADFVFASNVMLSMHLDDFQPDEFDYIVMDECHHAAAETYKKIMNYFKPGFMLGLTATPERMDNQDVFDMFDKNVPYELRLRDAIINDLVVPFHYYGIRDSLVDYSYMDATRIAKEIGKVENVEFISSEIEKHRPRGKLKAIAFCTTIQHAILMSERLEDLGYSTVALTGSNDLGQRIKAFNDLQDDSHPLEIICAVDILNEGVDIPQVNMVLFLRPTESSTIFLQQLGRGLRKYEGKQYVTVLDFIGNNYNRSVQIAMALGSLGKASVIEKPYLTELLQTDFRELRIPGVIINIDALAKENMIEFVKNTNFNTKAFLIKDYENFKKFLKKDTYPTHMDYLNNDCAPNIMRFMKTSMDGKKNYSYYKFLSKIGEKSLPMFSDSQIQFIDNVSELLPIVRVDEFIILNSILVTNKLDLSALIGYNKLVTKKTLDHALKSLVKSNILNDSYKLNVDAYKEEFLNYVNDLIQYGLERYNIEFGEFDTDFKMYANYQKSQIYKVLLEDYTMDKKQKGTRIEDGQVYVFVCLNKQDDKLLRMNYKDRFIDSTTFQWESKNGVSMESKEGKLLLASRKVHLFVKKMDEEDKIKLPFTYFGTGKFVNPRRSEVISNKGEENEKNNKTILFNIDLDNAVPEEYWFDFEIKEPEEISKVS